MSENFGAEKIRIVKIHDGTVIDHIRAGKALEVLKILGITGEYGNVVTLAMNITSSKIEKKDIVKVEHRFLADEEVARIALVAPFTHTHTAKMSVLLDSSRGARHHRPIHGLDFCRSHPFQMLFSGQLGMSLSPTSVVIFNV